MTRTRCCLSLVTVALAASFSLAQPPKDTKPAATPPAKDAKATQPAKPGDKPALPPGMSEADMQACMAAAQPGPNHEFLAKAAGTWSGKCKMWMAPGTEAAASDCTAAVTSFMDGRFTRVEVAGDMPGMGPFTGFGICGYDNVVKKFQQTWTDNCGTGMMTGTGELSADGRTLTWTMTGNCPIRKAPISMRQVEKRTGNDAMHMEMWGPDLATGKDFKMMEIDYTRTAKAPATATPAPAKNSAK